MESTPENLPERLMWFHEAIKDRPFVGVAAPIVEAAEEIRRLRNALKLAEISAKGAGSLLLDVQQDCIRLRQLLVKAEHLIITRTWSAEPADDDLLLHEIQQELRGG